MSWKFCPNCGHELPPAVGAPQVNVKASETVSEVPAVQAPTDGPYDQTKRWKEILARAAKVESPPSVESLVQAVCDNSYCYNGPMKSIVHVVMDRPVTPQGGALATMVLSDGRMSADLDRLQKLGYLIKDGRIEQVNDVPIGRTYCALQYWGGTRQHRRWHLTKPIDVNPSRHGDPFFMDDCYVAFGAEWDDKERLGEAMTNLIETLSNGFDGNPAGVPLLIDVHWSPTQ